MTHPNLEELMESCIREVKNRLKIADADMRSIIFAGSRVGGYSDSRSDVDMMIIVNSKDTPAPEIKQKYYLKLPTGEVVDVGIISLNSLQHAINDTASTQNTVRIDKLVSSPSISLIDKLVFSPSIAYRIDEDTKEHINQGLRNVVDNFLSLLESISGKVSKEQRVLFSLQSVVDWPYVARFLYENPCHRHRIARRLTSPNRQQLNNVMRQRYSAIINSFIETGKIEQVGGEIYAYLGERRNDRFTLYYPTVHHAAYNGVTLVARIAKRFAQKIESLPEHRRIFPINIGMQIKRKVVSIIEYAHLFYVLTKDIFSFKTTEEGATYDGPTLEKISCDSRSYAVLKTTYNKYRNSSADAIARTVNYNHGMIREA